MIQEFLFITVSLSIESLKYFPDTLWLGFKSGYSISAGYPQVRVLNAHKFAELKGFVKFAEVLKRPDFHWVGCDVIINILQLAHSMEVHVNIDLYFY